MAQREGTEGHGEGVGRSEMGRDRGHRRHRACPAKSHSNPNSLVQIRPWSDKAMLPRGWGRELSCIDTGGKATRHPDFSYALVDRWECFLRAAIVGGHLPTWRPRPGAPPVSFWLKTWIWQGHHLGSRMARVE